MGNDGSGIYQIGYTDGYSNIPSWHNGEQYPTYVMGYADGQGDRTEHNIDKIVNESIKAMHAGPKSLEEKREFLKSLKKYGVPITNG